MSLLITIDTDPDFTPKDAVPAPERLISGNPFFKTWAQDASKGEKVLTGVWEATPGGSIIRSRGPPTNSATSFQVSWKSRRRAVRRRPIALVTASS
jgi:hypothetical protein